MPSRARLLGPMLLTLVVGACQCDGGPPTGVCNGVWSGVTFTELAIDPMSRYATVYPGSCSEQALKTYDVSWGQGAATLGFSFRGSGPSILGEKTFALPSTELATFAVVPTVSNATGSITVGIVGVTARRTGTLSLSAGAEQLTCTFDLAFDTEGNRPSCGGSGSGGGGADFD